MDAKTVGQKLAELRRERGLTKKQVAKDLGCAYQSICSYEYGTRVPCDEMKSKLAKYYCVSVEYIFYTEKNYEAK